MTTNNTNTAPATNPPTYTPGQIAFIKFLQDNRSALTVFAEDTVSRKDLVALLEQSPYIAVPAWIAAPIERRAGRGMYRIPELSADIATLPVNGNRRGRRPGSPNQKGRTDDPTPNPALSASTTA